MKKKSLIPISINDVFLFDIIHDHTQTYAFLVHYFFKIMLEQELSSPAIHRPNWRVSLDGHALRIGAHLTNINRQLACILTYLLTMGKLTLLTANLLP